MLPEFSFPTAMYGNENLLCLLVHAFTLLTYNYLWAHGRFCAAQLLSRDLRCRAATLNCRAPTYVAEPRRTLRSRDQKERLSHSKPGRNCQGTFTTVDTELRWKARSLHSILCRSRSWAATVKPRSPCRSNDSIGLQLMTLVLNVRFQEPQLLIRGSRYLGKHIRRG